MVAIVNYQDWSIFGTRPSSNITFNIMPGDEYILNTPWFCCGLYSNYYCLLSDWSMGQFCPVFQGNGG